MLVFSLSSNALDQDHLEKIKAGVDRVVQAQLDSEMLVGAAIGVILKGKEGVWFYGKSNLATGAVVDPTTEFEIGSLTKTLTGIELADLISQGAIKLTDQVSRFFPELTNSDAGHITILQLATHTSGLPRIPDDLTLPLYNADDPYRYYDTPRLLAFLARVKIKKPSSEFDLRRYSNLGVGLLGLILTKAAHETSYERMIRQTILAPLAMKDTVILLSGPQHSLMAKGYNDVAEVVPPWNFTEATDGAGGFRSNIVDMMKYLRAVIKPPLNSLGKSINSSLEPRANGKSYGIAMTWILRGKGGANEVWHDGATGGYNSFLAFDRKRDVGFVILSNSVNPVQCVEEIVFGKDCKPTSDFPLTTNQSAQILGNFVFPNGLKIEIARRSSYLIADFIRPKERYSLRLHAKSETRFEMHEGLTTLDFVKSPNGLIDQVTLRDSSDPAVTGKRP
jgi:CubicO group peptidase (beta-lactamase class C family)